MADDNNQKGETIHIHRDMTNAIIQKVNSAEYTHINELGAFLICFHIFVIFIFTLANHVCILYIV